MAGADGRSKQTKGRQAQASAPACPGAARVPQETLDRFYVQFESRFRGDAATLRDRMSVYEPHLKRVPADVRDKGLLDLGCGTGDWLELVGQWGWQGTGVDSNAAMVEACKRRGIRAIHADGLGYLAGCADGSLGLVSSFHLVEHLAFEAILGWALDCFRVVTPGGMLIAETPDPENYRVGSYMFYFDLTHRNPVPSATLQFVLEFAGFEAVEILRLHPMHRSMVPPVSSFARFVERHFDTYQDYAAIARKPRGRDPR